MRTCKRCQHRNVVYVTIPLQGPGTATVPVEGEGAQHVVDACNSVMGVARPASGNQLEGPDTVPGPHAEARDGAPPSLDNVSVEEINLDIPGHPTAAAAPQELTQEQKATNKKRERLHRTLMTVVYHVFALYSTGLAVITFLGMGDAIADDRRPVDDKHIGSRGLSVLQWSIAAIWGLPLLLCCCVSWTSGFIYVKYSVPYVCLMPMYIGLVTAFALARLDDFSWGNRASELAEFAKRAEDFYTIKCAVNASTVVVNGLLMFGYIAVVHFQGHPAALFIAYSAVLFMPMVPSLVMALLYVSKRAGRTCLRLLYPRALRSSSRLSARGPQPGSSLVPQTA